MSARELQISKPATNNYTITGLFLAHILATCFLSLALVNEFWVGQTILTISTGLPYESQMLVSLLLAAASLYVVSYLVKRKGFAMRFRSWMLHVSIASLYFLAFYSLLSDLMNPVLAFFICLGISALYFGCAQHPHKLLTEIILPFLTMGLSIVIVFPLVLFLPLYFVVLISVVYAAYDIYAVFRGPLGQLIKGLKDKNKFDLLLYSGLATPIKGRVLGMGDSIFYSALFSTVYLNLGWVAGLASLIGISAGFVLTFSLAKSKPMPALPLSIALGLVLTGLAML